MATNLESESESESDRVLDPVERLSEILFGLIMAMTFTGSIHAASDGREEIHTVLFGAIGCNLAWGIVDAVMYVLTDLVERNRGLVLLRALRSAASPEEAHQLIAASLPDGVAEVVRSEELETVRIRLLQLPSPMRRARLTRRTLRGALGVFLLVALSTFPLVLPFLFVRDVGPALRISHATGLVLLFLVGSAFGRYAGQRPWATGLGMVAIGLVLVVLTIVLGG
jgi:VIT family